MTGVAGAQAFALAAFLGAVAASAVLVLRRMGGARLPSVAAGAAFAIAAGGLALASRRWAGCDFNGGPGAAPYAGFEQAAAAGLLVLAAALAAHLGWAAAARAGRRSVALVALAFVAALVPRLLFPADLLHSEQFGISLLSDMAGFPRPALFRFSWGQTSFLVLGAAMRAAGTFRAVFVANAVAAAATAVIWTVLVHRWTRSAWAAGAALLAISLHPGLLRIAASEDAHNLMLLFFSASLLALEIHLDAPDERREAALLAAVAAALCAWTRQTALLLLPMLPLVVVARGGLRALLRREVLAAAALVVLAVATHGAATGRADVRSLQVMARFVPRLLAAFVHEPSPLVDPLVSPLPLALLAAVGIAAAGRARGPLAAGVAVTWAFTGIFAFGDAGVRLLFRAPALLLWAASAGLGVAVLERLVAARWPRAFRASVALLAAGYAASAAAGMVHWGRRDPLGQELQFLAHAVDALPPSTVIVVPRYEDFDTRRDREEPKPEWRFPEFLLDSSRRADVRSGPVPPANDGRCTVFYRGLLCYTLAMGEASPEFRALWSARAGRDTPEFLEELVDALLALEAHPPHIGQEALRRARGACFGRAETVPLPGLTATISTPREPYVPNVVYAAGPMEVGFFALPGSGCAAAPGELGRPPALRAAP